MSDKIECAGYTKSGPRCKRNAAPDSIFCWQHKEIAEEKENLTKSNRIELLSEPEFYEDIKEVT